MLGLNQGFKPKFLRQFGQLGEAVKDAVRQYIDAVRDMSFPNQEESY
jgi:3-methyl-2-oxobutanoate hydroxymethyltransferase